MKPGLRLCLCLIILSTSTLLGQDRSYKISGVVLDSVTLKPLMGVYVTDGKKGSQTDVRGVFTLRGMNPGRVTLNTMYYSTYPIVTRHLNLNRDTTLTLLLTEQMLNLDDVVVTGTRSERRLSESPVLTTVISNREMQKAGSVSMLEALQDNVPGLVIFPNEMGNNLIIKGLNSRYILFLIDGERMVSEGAGGNINLDQIDVNNIKKIELINGAASALYGSNAVGAVINIITKEPLHKFEAGINLVGESNRTLCTSISAGANLEHADVRAAAFRNGSGGFTNKNSGAYAARYEDYGGDMKLGFELSKRIDLKVTGRYFRHETFNDKESMNVAHPLTENLAVGANSTITSRDRRNNLRLSVNLDKYFEYDVLEKKDNERKAKNRADYISSRIMNTFMANRRFELVAGLEYNHEQNFSTTTLGTTDKTKRIQDINLFTQGEYHLLKKFYAVVGARYTYNEQFKSAFTPKASLMYDLAGFKFRGGVATAFRAPSIKELYYDFDHQGMFWIYGNPNLKAERGVYWSLSSEYTHEDFNASLSAYYNRVNDKITQYDLITSEGKVEKHYKNVSSATLQGVDFNLSYIIARQLVLKGNYSYCDARDNSTGSQLMNNIRHSATASATWNGAIVRSPFSLQFAGRINSAKLYETRVGLTPVVSRSKAYSVWKVVLMKPFRLNKHTFELTLKADNIFNFSDASFINPGRQYLIGIRYNFK